MSQLLLMKSLMTDLSQDVTSVIFDILEAVKLRSIYSLTVQKKVCICRPFFEYFIASFFVLVLGGMHVKFVALPVLLDLNLNGFAS